MIDPLLNIAVPLPGASPASQEAAPGTPSFLPWMQPGQGGDAGSNAGTPTALPGPMAANPLAVHGAGLPPGEIPGHGPDAVVPSGLLSDSTSLVLDATRWRDFVAAMLELHVRNPQGEREVVAMPWRLMASGHLAHANAISGMPGQASAVGGAHPGTGMQAATAGASPGLSFMSPASSSPVFEGQGVPVAALHSQASSRTRDDVAALKTMSSHAPAAAEWLARWMKWIERDGRDAVVWLRDFSIDEDQAARVVEGLRSFAQAQGVGLERIVMNGRELWRNPQLAAFSEKRE